LPLPRGPAARLSPLSSARLMNSLLLILSLAALAALGLGGWMILRSVQAADDGFEDETGFHLGPEPVPRISSSLPPVEGSVGSLPR
jgi:hypothetical protein